MDLELAYLPCWHLISTHDVPPQCDAQLWMIFIFYFFVRSGNSLHSNLLILLPHSEDRHVLAFLNLSQV